MVMTTSDSCTASTVRILGCSAVMSMPTSAIASTATGLMRSPGAEPAERTSTLSPARWRSQPWAIWERPALWTQTNRTLGLADMGGAFLGGVGVGRVGRVGDDDVVGELGHVRVQHADDPYADEET